MKRLINAAPAPMIRIALLLSLATVAFGGTIHSPFLLMTGGGTSGVSITQEGVDIGASYTLSGTLCIVGYCPGEATPVGDQTSFNVPDPLALRLTNATITCTLTSGACGAGSFQIGFQLDGSAYSGAVPVYLSIAGSTGPLISLRIGGAIGTNTLSPANPASVPVVAGSFNSIFNFQSSHTWNANGSLPFNGPEESSPQIEVFINGLAAGQSVSLPNSLDLVFGGASTTVPEPATFGAAGFGLAALAYLGRRRR